MHHDRAISGVGRPQRLAVISCRTPGPAHYSRIGCRFSTRASTRGRRNTKPTELPWSPSSPSSSNSRPKLVRAAADEAWRIEWKYSRYRRGSIIDEINRANGRRFEVDEETARLLEFATEMYGLSKQRFDITSGVLRRVWNFDGGSQVPSSQDIEAVLELVGWHRVDWSSPWLQMPAGMEIDLGGIGKEYAVDRAAAILREQAPTSCLLNFGGDLIVTRVPQGFDHWRVGIDCSGPEISAPAKLLQLRVGALATSGDSRRHVLRGGRRLGHILDPATGWPIRGAPSAVTVAADSCTEAGMLSTLAILEGEGAERFRETF